MKHRRHASEAAYIVTDTNLGASRPENYVASSADAIHSTAIKPWLETVGVDVVFAASVQAPEANREDTTNAKNLEAIVQHSEAVAAIVEEQRRKGRLIIATGGDHSMSLGTVAGIEAAADGDVGMFIIDRHLDFNTPETTPSGNIHGFPLAANTGQPGGDEQEKLINIHRKGPKLKPQNALVVGVNDTDPGELERALGAKVGVVTMEEFEGKERDLRFIFDKIDALRKRVKVLYVSIDMDGISQQDAPGTPMPNSHGLAKEEVLAILRHVREEDGDDVPVGERRAPVVGVEVVELAPELDVKGRSKLLVHDMIKEVMHWNQAGTPIELSKPPNPRELHEEIHDLLRRAVGDVTLWKAVDAEVAKADVIYNHEFSSRTIGYTRAVDKLEEIKTTIEKMLGSAV